MAGRGDRRKVLPGVGKVRLVLRHGACRSTCPQPTSASHLHAETADGGGDGGGGAGRARRARDRARAALRGESRPGLGCRAGFVRGRGVQSGPGRGASARVGALALLVPCGVVPRMQPTRCRPRRRHPPLPPPQAVEAELNEVRGQLEAVGKLAAQQAALRAQHQLLAEQNAATHARLVVSGAPCSVQGPMGGGARGVRMRLPSRKPRLRALSPSSPRPAPDLRLRMARRTSPFRRRSWRSGTPPSGRRPRPSAPTSPGTIAELGWVGFCLGETRKGGCQACTFPFGHLRKLGWQVHCTGATVVAWTASLEHRPG